MGNRAERLDAGKGKVFVGIQKRCGGDACEGEATGVRHLPATFNTHDDSLRNVQEFEVKQGLILLPEIVLNACDRDLVAVHQNRRRIACRAIVIRAELGRVENVGRREDFACRW